jgi:hypothetical protein
VKIRNPKAEGRKKSEARNPKSEKPSRAGADRPPGYFGFRASAFFRVSDFGLRISALLLISLAMQFSLAAATNLPSEDPIPPLRPPRGEIAPTFWEQHGVWVIITGVIVLGAVAFAAWWLMRPKPAALEPPDVEACKTLESLRQKPEDGALLSQISHTLRHYVSVAFALPPGEMTTSDFCRAINEQGRLGDELSSKLGDFLRSCDQRKFAPPGFVASRVPPAVEDGILPPGQGSAPPVGAVPQALKLIELAEARRAQLPPAAEPGLPPQGSRAYRGVSKG